MFGPVCRLVARNLQRVGKLQRDLNHLAAVNRASETREVREFNVPVPWGNIAVKEWGPKDGKPVLCLHGWLDNVNSFDRLIALLPHHYRFVSFDLPGHGLSSHRSHGSCYGVVEYASDIVRVVEHLNLDRFPMIGHSLGARLCFMYSTLYPKKVTKVVSLDEANPYVVPVVEQHEVLGSVIQEELEQERMRDQVPKSYLREEGIDLMLNAGFQRVTAETLFSRGFRPVGDGQRYVLNRDPRVRRLRIFMLMSGEVIPYTNQIFTKDLLLFLTSNSAFKMTQDPDGSFREAYARNCRSYKLIWVEGSHYAHIENPQFMSSHITDFLRDGAH